MSEEEYTITCADCGVELEYKHQFVTAKPKKKVVCKTCYYKPTFDQQLSAGAKR